MRKEGGRGRACFADMDHGAGPRRVALVAVACVGSLGLCHVEIIGYSLRRFTRASSVVNCQWAWRSFRCRFHAWTLVSRVALAARRPPRPWRRRGRSALAALLHQRPCLGVEGLSNVAAILWACAGAKASYSDAVVGVCRDGPSRGACALREAHVAQPVL